MTTLVLGDSEFKLPRLGSLNAGARLPRAASASPDRREVPMPPVGVPRTPAVPLPSGAAGQTSPPTRVGKRGKR